MSRAPDSEIRGGGGGISSSACNYPPPQISRESKDDGLCVESFKQGEKLMSCVYVKRFSTAVKKDVPHADCQSFWSPSLTPTSGYLTPVTAPYPHFWVSDPCHCSLPPLLGI